MARRAAGPAGVTASAATAALLPVGDAYLGDLDGPTDADWIRAELTAGAGYLVTIAARDPDGDGPRRGARDTILEIYNEQQELIASMDDQALVDSVLPVGGFHPQLDFTPASGGVHYFRVSSFISPNKDNSGGYRLELEETRPAPDPAPGAGPGGDPDGGTETSAPVAMVDDGAEAARLEVGGVHLGVLDGPSDSAWITATLTGGTTYILAVASRDPDGGGPLSGAKDTELKIYNGQDDLVASADDQALVNGVLPVGGMHPRLSFTPGADGDYFFRVSSFIFPGEDYSGGYQLELTEAPAPPPAPEPDPDPDPAPGPDADPDTGGPSFQPGPDPNPGDPDPDPAPDPDPDPAPDTDGPTDDGDGDPEPEPGGPLDDWIKENIGDDSDGRGPGTQPPPGGWPDTIPENTKLSEIESESEPDPDPPNPNPGPAPAPEQQEPPYVLHTGAERDHSHPLTAYTFYSGGPRHDEEKGNHPEKALTGAADFDGELANEEHLQAFRLVYAGGKKEEDGYVWYGHDETATFSNRINGKAEGVPHTKYLVGGYGDDVLDVSGAFYGGNYLYGDGLKVPALSYAELRLIATGAVPIDRTRTDNGPVETFGYGHDRLIGGPSGDYLYGAGGNDHLDGGNGHDYLDGGPGNDLLKLAGSGSLIGGRGYDVFDVSSARGTVRIWDFQDGADKIKIGVATETNLQWEMDDKAYETEDARGWGDNDTPAVGLDILGSLNNSLYIIGADLADLQFEVVGGDLFIV